MSANPFVPANRLAPTMAAPAAITLTTTTAQLAKPGSYGRGRFVVRGTDLRASKQGPFLQVTIGDKAGEVNAICWKGAPLASQLTIGTVIQIERFNVDDYGPKFEHADLKVLPVGEYRPDEFVQSLPAETIEANWAEFHGFLDSLQNPHLVLLRTRIWGDAAIAQRYKVHPSAVHHHHAYIGGNVQHVLGIMRIVEAVATSYPELDRDLCIFGAAVHDLGKLREYDVTTTIRVTEEGRLRGHLVIGAEWIAQIVAKLREDGHEFPKRLEDDLVHMILSHHGKGEWGSPKPPATPEAMLLHLADYADSQAKKFLENVAANAAHPEGWVKKFDADIGESRWIRTRREDEA